MEVERLRAVGLEASDAVVALTTRDHTMQRGAYEAIYLGRPVITSNFALLREAFHKGAVHVDADVNDIVRGVRTMQDNLSDFTAAAIELRQEKLDRWKQTAALLRRPSPALLRWRWQWVSAGSPTRRSCRP
jgi:hypothetical protein